MLKQVGQSEQNNPESLEFFHSSVMRARTKSKG